MAQADNVALENDLQVANDRQPDNPPVEDKSIGEAFRDAEPLPDKVIIAVHGMGDQFKYAAIQSVVAQFCYISKYPAAVPLGSFHQKGKAFIKLDQHLFKGAQGLLNMAFAEVYWADIPRRVIKRGYTIEEAKQWGQSVVERLRIRANGGGQDSRLSEDSSKLIKQVLEELIETIAVLERLSFIANKAGIFTFDLRKVLDDYLGDVQIVTEFGTEREKIIETFQKVMGDIHKACPKAELYVIAHSEGTVVSFLGLLRGIKKRHATTFAPDQEPDPEITWIENVRGFMTFGSPIDKHLILWPELWAEFEGTKPSWKPTAPDRIEWRNYYDKGDPVGYELDEARAWLNKTGNAAYNRCFNFNEKLHDLGFERYALPGKAHVDYWKDKALFEHFINEVVNKPNDNQLLQRASAAGPNTTSRSQQKEIQPVIASKKWERLIARWFPYPSIFALLCLAAFILYKAMHEVTGWGSDNNIDVILECFGVAFLMLGITLAVRIPRLTKQPRIRRLWGGVTPITLAIVYFILVNLIPPDEGVTQASGLRGVTRLSISLAFAVIATLLSRKWPHKGTKPMMATAVVGIVVLVGINALQYKPTATVWPLFLAIPAFIYIWWLAVLIFDLIFVWHFYIRQTSQAKSYLLQCMGEIVGSESAKQNQQNWAWQKSSLRG